MDSVIRILMVTGAYYPELSGGGLQCRELIHALGPSAACSVLTTSTNPALPRTDAVEGVPVHRIMVDVRCWRSKVAAALRTIRVFLRLRRRIDVIHVHGFSQKVMLIAPFAKLLRKPLILSLHTAGQDEPGEIYKRGWWASRCLRMADAVVAVSPQLAQQHRAAGLPGAPAELIMNGIDADRFRPAAPQEQARLRRELGLPEAPLLILFVGFFSQEKHPRLLFDAWVRAQAPDLPPSELVLVGATKAGYFEIDPSLAPQIRADAQALGRERQLHFVESSTSIESYYRAADLFVLPSTREAMPRVLLEAMASGLPCIASRLPGSTDTVIGDGVNGRLIRPGSVEELAQALRELLRDPQRRARLGRQARQRIVDGFSVQRAADAHRQVYQRLAPPAKKVQGLPKPRAFTHAAHL